MGESLSLGERARRIRLTKADVARATGLYRATVARVFAGSSDVIQRNRDLVEAAIEAEERRLAAQLNAEGAAA